MTQLFSLNSHCAKVDGLQALDENGVKTFVNDAAVDITITKKNGDTVTGETWPVTIPFVSGSDGNYFKELSKDLSIVAGDVVRVEMNATSPSGSRINWDDNVKVTTRKLFQ